MASSKKTPIDKLNTALGQILEEYGNDVSANLDTIIRKMCQKGATAIKGEAGTAVKGKEYKKSWTYKVIKTRYNTEGVIYSKQPGLPHLLEYGHVIRSGGRITGLAKPHPHIEPVADRLAEEFEREVKSKL